MLSDRNSPVLDDRVHRALGALRSARLLGAEEAMKLLSRVRLGIHMERVKDVSIETVNELFLQVQTTHLKMHAGTDLDAEELREARANLVRQRLTKP
jgi:protein arginine kinase